MIQSTPLQNIGKPTVERAKSGILSHYKEYPSVARRVNRAIGGKNGKLPYWFQYSKNGRKSPAPGKKKRTYLEPNNSTVNRVCNAFKDIGNINLHNAEIPPFNWQMFLEKSCEDMRYDICKVFCEMDDINMSSVIESKDFDYVTERESKACYDLLAKMITEEMTEQFGSLKVTYPYIVKCLFAGKAADKAVHKQMFWRVYGDIALNNLKKNLENYNICPDCGMKYPGWVKQHTCPKTMRGFFTCVDCDKLYPRMNGKQCRCEQCQEEYKASTDRARKKAKYDEMKEQKKQRIGILVSRLKKK